MWSRKHEHCVDCKGTEFKHMGRGLCARCYQRRYAKAADHAPRINRQKSDWYLRNRERLLLQARLRREQTHFSGKREAVLARDGQKCTECPATTSLVVHHKDGNGRGNDNPNNDLDNLVTLCRRCHLYAHRDELVRTRKAKQKHKI